MRVCVCVCVCACTSVQFYVYIPFATHRSPNPLSHVHTSQSSHVYCGDFKVSPQAIKAWDGVPGYLSGPPPSLSVSLPLSPSMKLPQLLVLVVAGLSYGESGPVACFCYVSNLGLFLWMGEIRAAVVEVEVERVDW